MECENKENEEEKDKEGHELRCKEVPIVSDNLLTFISNLFGGIPILLVGDLAQLPLVKDHQHNIDNFHYKMYLHKTKGLTLPHFTVSIDESMFATGQAYVALSHSPSLELLNIVSFDVSAIKVDEQMLVKYTRLKDIFDKGIRQRITNVQN
ncbi:hypothetical protein Glove_184g141 [Diversispora epigaea]|uniref:DNA helicase n=1 Tax=Diversispora epigaea TaxID=1348612 RepID=A0A397IMQ7_9GLOM|nr:hypothetical protein Glove_184g141 [Diversispora epigaea]